MAFFAVTFEVVSSVRNHPGADRLDLCVLEGLDFQFVTVRGQFKPGDKVVYFPVESVIPETVLLKLGLTGKLAGVARNRVKTILLRGEISQGIVARPEKVLDDPHASYTPEELTSLLGVVKYEPPPKPMRGGILVPLPDCIGVYDIESADRFVSAADSLMSQRVLITEKLEGSNFSITIGDDGGLYVNMRNNSIIPIENDPHYFWNTASKMGFLEKIRAIKASVDEDASLEKFHKQSVTLYGELIGPGEQGNIYGLKDYTIRAFDIRTTRGFLDACSFLRIAALHRIPTVPVLANNVVLSEWLGGVSIKEASVGKSILVPNVDREGIVIRPMVESRWERGRLILKQHSPRYLASSS